MEKNRLFKLSKYGMFALYLIIIVLVNIVINITPPGKLDLTANNLFSISKASKEAVKTLEDPLTIKVFFTNNLSAPYNVIKPYIRDILKEYADSSNKRYFNYEFIDVGGGDDTESESVMDNQTLANEYNINAINIQTYDNDKVSVRRVYMGMAFIHGDIVETISPIQSTNGLEFRITSTIQKLNNKVSALLGLQEKIKVQLFLSSDLRTVFKGQADVEGLNEKVHSVFERINKKNFSKLELYTVDPTREPERVGDAENMNAYYVTLQNGTKLYADMFISYGERSERLPIIDFVRTPFGLAIDATGEEDLEVMLNDAITSLINTNEKIGYLVNGNTLSLKQAEQNPFAGPNDPQPRQGITNFASIIGDEYSLVEVNLDEGGIPEGINTLVIAGPEQRFTDYQLFQIDQFLMQGKSLALFLPGMKVEIPQVNEQLYGQMPPQFMPLQTGLESLLAHYGVTVEPSYVFDENSYETADPQMGQFKVFQIPLIQNEKMNSKVDFIQNIRGMLVWEVSPLTLDENLLEKNNIKATRLFSSSDKSWTEKELPDQQTMFFKTPPSLDEDKQSYPLAYILEGKFPSYYSDKPIPEKPVRVTEEGEEPATVADNTVNLRERSISVGSPGKVFVIGSKQILDNQIFSQNFGQNMLCYMNVLDYLNGRGEYAKMRTKLQTFNPLNETEKFQRDFIKIFNMAGIPILMALLGVFVFFRRKSRREAIQERFSSKIKK